MSPEEHKAATIAALNDALKLAEEGKLVLIEAERPAFEGMPFATVDGLPLSRRFEPGPDLYLHFRYEE